MATCNRRLTLIFGCSCAAGWKPTGHYTWLQMRDTSLVLDPTVLCSVYALLEAVTLTVRATSDLCLEHVLQRCEAADAGRPTAGGQQSLGSASMA